MYNGYDGIHMPPVMSYTIGVMYLTEGVMTYRVDEMAILLYFIFFVVFFLFLVDFVIH